MKNLFKLLLLCLFTINFTSCKDHIPEVEDLPEELLNFTYQVSDDIYQLDYYVGATIKFYPTVEVNTDCVWDFGDGQTMEGDEVKHFYAKAGTYKVKLTVGDFSKENVVMIAPIKPIVTIKVADPVCEVRSSLVTFDVELPNPQNKPATFSWTFPKDTKNAEDADYATFVGQSVTDLPAPVKFFHVGSQEVVLNVNLGGEELETTTLNVQVGYNQEVPTLYYAVQGGRIMAHKLTGGKQPADMEVSSFDLGVSSGQHPFNILFKDSSLYVLDAGKQFYYVNDVDGVLGDGKISVVSKDGKKVETMLTNANQAAFDDPFYGCIDGDYLYYANRNTGIMKVKLTDRDKVYNINDYLRKDASVMRSILDHTAAANAPAKEEKPKYVPKPFTKKAEEETPEAEEEVAEEKPVKEAKPKKSKKKNALPEPDFDLADTIEGVRAQKDEREERIAKVADERETFNREAKEQRKIRDELNSELKENLAKAIEFRDQRNEINKQVEENKKARNKVNDEIKNLEWSSGKKDKIRIEAEIKKIDKIIETRVLDIKKENQLVKNANDLRKELAEIKEDDKVKEEAAELKKKSEEYHAKVVELSEQAQEAHEQMLSYFRKTDEIRTAADEAHKLFIQARKNASAKHEEFKMILSEIHVINKKLGSSKNRKRRSDKSSGSSSNKKNREEKERAESIFDKFKNGKKDAS